MANPLDFAWAQQAAQQDPATYNQGTASFSADPYQVKANRQMLMQAGLWQPEWDQWFQDQEGATAQPDLSSLDGYTVNNYRGPGYGNFAQLMDPSGQQAGLDEYQAQHSMHGKDWLTAAAVVGGGMLGGQYLGGLTGGGLGGAGAAGAAEAGIGTLGSIAPGAGALAPIGATGAGTVGSLTAGLGELGTVGAGLGGAGGVAGAAGGAGGGLSGAWNGTSFGATGGNTLGSSLSSIGNSLMSPSGLASLASTGIGLYGQNKAIGAMRDATNQSNDLQRSMFDTIRADNQPLVDMRNGVLPQIQALLKNPGSITQNPGYQFQFGEGQKALNNGAAGRGMTYSGAQGKALQRYGNDYAGTKLDQSLNRLTNVAGLGQVGSNSNNNAAGNYGNSVSNNLLNQGQANASMYGNRATIGGNALSDIFNPWQQDQFNRRGP